MPDRLNEAPLNQGPRRPASAAQQDYLKALYALGAQDNVSTSELALELGVRPASASEMLVKLAEAGLVQHDPYRGARLTPAGESIALEMVRHHRLLETYLVVALGYTWDEVHIEADRLEHTISEKLETRMWEALGRPGFDPHGDPIPAPDGSLAAKLESPLAAMPVGSSRLVSRILDRDPERLRALEAIGLLPGTRVTMIAPSRWEGPIEVEVDGVAVPVPLGLARAVFMERDDGRA
ncbi:MAG TPA: metal-dependent transcriptional regulator [Candidatus Nitrosotalea sp.]|nr:metal-dependent transcriptional regulator [Candidatus Nitrosotalea sp.]